MSSFDHALLRAWHRESGMSLEEAAYRARVSYPRLPVLLDHGGNPSAALLARLAELYGHSIGELFADRSDPAGAR